MNVISVLGGKVHKPAPITAQDAFPLCRTGGATNRGTKYLFTEAEVTCKVCMSYDAPAPEEAPQAAPEPKAEEKPEPKVPAREMTREEWLHRAIDLLRPRFKEIGFPIPEKIHVSVGFGYGAKRESATILGQCWPRGLSEDGVNHIFISPEMNEAARVLDVLVHELVHAADDCKSGHKGPFAVHAKKLGLTGAMTATVAGRDLAEAMRELAREIGPYSHARLSTNGLPIAPKKPEEPKGENPEESPEESPEGPEEPLAPTGPKKQGTRMIKVACSEECECGGYVVRTTAKWIEVGMPVCPFGTVMEVA